MDILWTDASELVATGNASQPLIPTASLAQCSEGAPESTDTPEKSIPNTEGNNMDIDSSATDEETSEQTTPPTSIEESIEETVDESVLTSPVTRSIRLHIPPRGEMQRSFLRLILSPSMKDNKARRWRIAEHLRKVGSQGARSSVPVT